MKLWKRQIQKKKKKAVPGGEKKRLKYLAEFYRHKDVNDRLYGGLLNQTGDVIGNLLASPLKKAFMCS